MKEALGMIGNFSNIISLVMIGIFIIEVKYFSFLW
jgi:hypothetical protein